MNFQGCGRLGPGGGCGLNTIQREKSEGRDTRVEKTVKCETHY